MLAGAQKRKGWKERKNSRQSLGCKAVGDLILLISCRLVCMVGSREGHDRTGGETRKTDEWRESFVAPRDVIRRGRSIEFYSDKDK